MQHEFIRLECISCGNHFDVPVYCGDRFCPVCSVTRRLRVRSRLEFLVKNVKAGSGYNFKHLTLTIKNQQHLSLMTAAIVKSFRQLRQTASWKSHVKGGAFVIEITGDSSNWHVHLHIIIESKYYKWANLLNLWKKFSTGQGVYIQNIPRREIIRYLTKYISKTDTPPECREAINDALRGTRLFQPFGSWYSINRLYTKPAVICKECKGTCFMISGEYSDYTDLRFWKEVPP